MISIIMNLPNKEIKMFKKFWRSSCSCWGFASS